MFGFVKMATLSAVLSYGVVTAYGPVPASGDAGPAKPYQDRVLPAGESASLQAAILTTGSVAPAERVSPAGKGDRLEARAEGAPPRRPVRVITIESRAGVGTSVLARVPQAGPAPR